MSTEESKVEESREKEQRDRLGETREKRRDRFLREGGQEGIVFLA
jgi:hypothetical protein